MDKLKIRKQDPSKNKMVPITFLKWNAIVRAISDTAPLGSRSICLGEGSAVQFLVPLAGTDPLPFHIKAVRISYTTYLMTLKYSPCFKCSVNHFTDAVSFQRLQRSSDPGEQSCSLPMSARHQGWLSEISLPSSVLYFIFKFDPVKDNVSICWPKNAHSTKYHSWNLISSMQRK